jgi:hypothetical protein
MILLISLFFFITLPLCAQSFEDASEISQHINLKEGQNIYLKVSAEITQESLMRITKDLASKGIDLQFSKIERNENNLITHIVMDVKIGEYQKTIESLSEDKPIADPLIFYYLNRDNKFGLSVGIPENLPKDQSKKFNSFRGLLIGKLE